MPAKTIKPSVAIVKTKVAKAPAPLKPANEVDPSQIAVVLSNQPTEKLAPFNLNIERDPLKILTARKNVQKMNDKMLEAPHPPIVAVGGAAVFKQLKTKPKTKIMMGANGYVEKVAAHRQEVLATTTSAVDASPITAMTVKPKVKRILTDEQKDVLRARLVLAREARVAKSLMA